MKRQDDEALTAKEKRLVAIMRAAVLSGRPVNVGCAPPEIAASSDLKRFRRSLLWTLRHFGKKRYSNAIETMNPEAE